MMTPLFPFANPMLDISQLNIQEKIGQLLMVGFTGLEPNAAVCGLLQQRHVGGVILFRRNMASPQQVAALTSALQANRSNAVPLLIAVDQEGGVVARLEEGVTPLPSAMAFAAAGSAADCTALTQRANQELKMLGVNVNLAPVLDVNNNRDNPVIGVRAYGEEVASVCEYGLAAMRGIDAAGVAPTAKHFPGHGDTAVDSHLGLPVVTHTRARLDAVELAPFRAAITAGVPAIMSAHVVFPAIEAEPGRPSTLSAAVLTGLLREEMGFKGVIFTDCLEMAAIAEGIGVVQGALQAFQAGADVLLVSHRQDRQEAVAQALLAAVHRGEISMARLDASVQRILALKARYAANVAEVNVPKVVHTPESLALSARVHAAAVRSQGPVPVLPVGAPVWVVEAEVREHTEIDEPDSEPQGLAHCLLAQGCVVRQVRIPLRPAAVDQAALLAALPAEGAVVMLSYNATLFQEQADLLRQLPASRLWLVAGRLPYDLDLCPQAQARLTAFSNRPAALQAVAAVLLAGRI